MIRVSTPATSYGMSSTPPLGRDDYSEGTGFRTTDEGELSIYDQAGKTLGFYAKGAWLKLQDITVP